MGEPAPKRRKHSRWTKAEEKRLEELWGTMRDSEVAAIIGKTTQAARRKAVALGLMDDDGVAEDQSSSTSLWTDAEDLILVKNVGHLNIFELMELLPGRSRVAIERRCYEKGFSPSQGTYSRLQIERETQYDWRQIQRAKEALGQTWKRYGLRKFMISDEQVQEIIDYLATEQRKWSLQYGLDECRKCGHSGSDDRSRHSGDGLCKRCWDGRRHARKSIVTAIKRGQAVRLTEEIWRECIVDDGESL